MSDHPPLLTLQQVTEGVLAPWFSGENLAAGDRVATPKDAAARAVWCALNTSGEKGVIRILVPSSELKRATLNFLVAFMSDVLPLKKLVKRQSQEGAFHLHGGVSIVVDTNDIRLAKDALATIVLDPTVDEALGLLWVNEGETREDAAIRRGIDPALAGRYRAFRWLTEAEATAGQIAPPWDEPHPDEPVVPAPDLVQERLDRAAWEKETTDRYEAAIEKRKREDAQEKVIRANRLFGRSIA